MAKLRDGAVRAASRAADAAGAGDAEDVASAGEANTMATPTKSTPETITCQNSEVCTGEMSETKKELARTKEQQRLVVMNAALKNLREVLPNEYCEYLKKVSKDKMRTSKVQTIRFATSYIAALSRLLGHDIEDYGGINADPDPIPEYPREALLAMLLGIPMHKRSKAAAHNKGVPQGAKTPKQDGFRKDAEWDYNNTHGYYDSSFVDVDGNFSPSHRQSKSHRRKRKRDLEHWGSAKKYKSCTDSSTDSAESDTDSIGDMDDITEIDIYAKFEFVCTCRICEEDGLDMSKGVSISCPEGDVLLPVTPCDL